METTPTKRAQRLAYLALQVNTPLIKIGIGIGMEKSIMERLAPHAQPDTIALTAKALLGAEIIIIKMKQEKLAVKVVQMAHLAQTLQALHVQVVTENVQLVIKALQIVQVAMADIIYQVQVAPLVLLMQVVAVEQMVITAIQTHISTAQTAQHAQLMLYATEAQTGAVMADIRCKMEVV